MNEKALKIIRHYGVDNQLKKLSEEVFELQQAIIETEMTEYITNEIEHITEKMADVMVLLSQLKEYYEISAKEVNKIMVKKVDRQLERIKNEKTN